MMIPKTNLMMMMMLTFASLATVACPLKLAASGHPSSAWQGSPEAVPWLLGSIHLPARSAI